MLRIEDIVAGLADVVGTTAAGTSGLAVLGSHPLLTEGNIAAIMPEGADVDDFLATQLSNGITQAVQRFAQDKQLWRQSRDLMQRKPFFDGAGRLANTITPSHKIVGFEITPVRSMGVTARIERIGLQFVSALKEEIIHYMGLYLFHSSQDKPIRKVGADVRGDGVFAWVTPKKPLYLPYANYGNVTMSTDDDMAYNGTNTGGSYYLVYNQDDIPYNLEAVSFSKDWSREPCGTCNMGSARDWRELTKYLQISPFMVAAPDNWGHDPTLWDIGAMMYTNTQSYGLNCVVSVACDITDFIISQKETFANVIQKQTAYNLLRTIALNPYARVNRNQVNAMRGDILYELDGNTQGRATGLGADLERSYKALRISTEGIDRICLTCANRGVNYGIV